MKSEFERYIEKILQQTECTPEERADIAEELQIHLLLSKEELMNEGLQEKEAERAAMRRFGPEKDIGCQLQQSIFPYRKELMLTLSLSGFAFSIAGYVLALMVEGDAHIGWLAASMLANLLLFLIALNQVARFNSRRWMNGLLIAAGLTALYGYGFISSVDHGATLPLGILSWLTILLVLLLIYQTTIYQMNVQKGLEKEARRLHLMNLISGVVAAGLAVFTLWIGLWLFGGFHPLVLVMAIPFGLWIFLYFLQMKLLEKHQKSAFVIAIISIVLSASALLFPIIIN